MRAGVSGLRFEQQILFFLINRQCRPRALPFLYHVTTKHELTGQSCSFVGINVGVRRTWMIFVFVNKILSPKKNRTCSIWKTSVGYRCYWFFVLFCFVCLFVLLLLVLFLFVCIIVLFCFVFVFLLLLFVVVVFVCFVFVYNCRRRPTFVRKYCWQ